MKLLTDSDLAKELGKKPSIIEGVPLPPGGDWFVSASAVQPSSIDLHIGQIFLPEAKKGKPGHESTPLQSHILEAGHTAVVTTSEAFSLPANIAGIGFPPDSVSSQGILMTNPGHIDPGYKGTLRFTLINMGRQPYSLRAKDSIVTILLFELSTAAHKDYCSRHPGQISGTEGIQKTLDRLSADFVDVKRRAERIAAKKITTSGLWAAVVPTIASALIAGVIAFVVGRISQEPLEEVKRNIAVLQSKPDASELKTDIRVLQGKVDPTELRNQISGLQQQLAELRRQIQHN